MGGRANLWNTGRHLIDGILAQTLQFEYLYGGFYKDLNPLNRGSEYHKMSPIHPV
jgi:hypothetical protein